MKKTMKTSKAKPIKAGSQDPRSMALSTMRGTVDPQKDTLHPSLDKGALKSNPMGSGYSGLNPYSEMGLS